jgi:hypothetical protein
MAAYAIVTPDKRHAANRAFENRVEHSFGGIGVFRLATWITLVFALPGFCALVASRHAGAGTPLGIQLAIDAWTSSALLVLIIIFAVIEGVAFWRTGFPPPPTPSTVSRLRSAVIVFMNLLMLEMFVGNLFFLLRQP